MSFRLVYAWGPLRIEEGNKLEREREREKVTDVARGRGERCVRESDLRERERGRGME